MRKTTPVNTVLEALEMFQQGTATTEVRTPTSLQSVRKRFLDAKEAGKRVLIENSDLSSANSVVVDIDYVGSRWCLGYQKYCTLEKRYAFHILSISAMYMELTVMNHKEANDK